MENNIKEFNLCVANLFSELYDSFPLNKCIFRYDYVADPDYSEAKGTPYYWPEDKERNYPSGYTFTKEEQEKRKVIYEAYAKSISIFAGTLDFLVAEGFVRCSGKPRHGRGEYYVLTAKGFSQLNVIFEDAEIRNSTVMLRIKKALKSKTPDALLQIIPIALSGL